MSFAHWYDREWNATRMVSWTCERCGTETADLRCPTCRPVGELGAWDPRRDWNRPQPCQECGGPWARPVWKDGINLATCTTCEPEERNATQRRTR